ncbi:hypothetical protein [Mesorhizobium sp.]|uniref:hypothetical protein n=1 Tax=Mesorhizobium sp. TaxID=1871066 RepID=UPI0025E87DC1|nr:hypothetical protein [Mesorhizobium sp.]
MVAIVLETAWNTKEQRMPGRNQQLVLDALTRSDRPMGAYELLGLLRQEGLRSPLQIYHALDRLIEEGLIHRIESLSAFALCVHGDAPMGAPPLLSARIAGEQVKFTIRHWSGCCAGLPDGRASDQVGHGGALGSMRVLRAWMRCPSSCSPVFSAPAMLAASFAAQLLALDLAQLD